VTSLTDTHRTDEPTMTTEPRRRNDRRTSTGLARRRRRVAFEMLEPRQLLAGGLAVVRVLPTGAAGHPFDTLDVLFNGPVQDGGFPVSAVTLLAPGGSAVTPKSVNKDAPDRYTIDFTGETTASVYHLTIGTAVKGADGRALDQDHNGTPGEPADAYVANLFGAGVNIAAAVATFDGAALIVDGGTATIDGAHAFTDVELVGGAVATVSPPTAAGPSKLDLTVADELYIDAASKIDVSGLGYAEGTTVGNTTTGGAAGTGGGSYGGLGSVGPYTGDATNATYGDYRDPSDFGSGGGGERNSGGVGGGLARVTAGSARIDGAVLADGNPGIYNAYRNGSGGSGGGVSLRVAGVLSGAGRVAADGGAADPAYGVDTGAGGGGRVAISYGSLQGFDVGKVTALPGTLRPAGVGTVYLAQAGAPGRLLIDSHGKAVGAATPLGQATDTAFVVDDLVVTGAGVVALPVNGLPIRVANLSLLNGAVLTSQPTTFLSTFPLLLTVTGALTIDAASKIDVTGLGYPGGYPTGTTVGNTTTGGATDGASYGGHGGAQPGFTTNPTYGDPNDPNDVGSGGAGDRGSGGAGGGLVRVTAGSARIDGAVLADGNPGIYSNYRIGSGGSGGGIALHVGTLAGSGRVSAGGGAGGVNYGFGATKAGAGGGGRVAVNFASLASFDTSKITARGGTGGTPGGDGTVVVRAANPFTFADPGRPLEHGVVTIRPLTLVADPSKLTADLALSGPTFGATLATGLAANAPFPLDSTKVPDGRYLLRVTFRDASGASAGEATRNVTINNAAVYHSGPLSASQTWSAGTVHVVEGPVVVPNGVTLTVAPGAVVKFEPKTSITVQDGGTFNAPATPAAPTVLTSVRDDSVGGDTNLDGAATRPEPGDWAGLSAPGTGSIRLTDSVDLRFTLAIRLGTLRTDTTWSSTLVNDVVETVVVPSGVTLTIAPGAVVKFRYLQGIEVQNGGHLVALGTVSLPINFTSSRDDTVGGDTNGDGDATTPAPGDWSGLGVTDD